MAANTEPLRDVRDAAGWGDLVAVDYAVKINGIDGIALTKLDVLSALTR